MSYTNGLDDPTLYFNTKLYTGDDTNNRQIALDWSPDFTWIKARNVAYSHILFDRIRGLGFSFNSNGTNADRNVGSEFSWSNSGCTTDSFTVDRGSNESLNESSRPMVAWNWLGANGTASNSDGSITSTVSANTTAGFSIVSYTGTGSNATIGHGLGSAPKMIIFKSRSNADAWSVYNVNIGSANNLTLNNTDGTTSNATMFNSIDATSSVFSVGTHNRTNRSSGTFVAYCFAEKTGYSKISSYTGNGNADGTFVYTGFKPAFTIIKRTDATDNWFIQDNIRQANANFDGNPVNIVIQGDLTNAETNASSRSVDYLSNGFKIRTTNGGWNASGGNFIYMAFAENPFKNSNAR